MKRPLALTLLLTLAACAGALAALLLAKSSMLFAMGAWVDSSHAETASFVLPFAFWTVSSIVIAWLVVRRSPAVRTAGAVYLVAMVVELATLAVGRFYSLPFLPTASKSLQELRANCGDSSHSLIMESALLFVLIGALLWWTYHLVTSPAIEIHLSVISSPRAKERAKEWTYRRLLSLIAVLAAVGATWWFLTPTLDRSVGSPHGVYRLDQYVPSPLQQALHLRYRIPRFVRLYRVNPDLKLLGESEVVDMDQGQGRVFWMIEEVGKVSVGMQISFEDIGKECDPTCPEWPLSPPTSAETRTVKP